MRIALAVFLVACSSDPSVNSGEQGPDDEAPDAGEEPAVLDCSDRGPVPQNSVWTIRSGGVDREFRVHVPASYDPSVATPLVLNFHGYTQSAAAQEETSLLNTKADTAGFVAVHPDGLGIPQSWNFLEFAAGADDYGFVDDMLDELEARLCVDTKRVYSTGLSNGAFLSNELACRFSDRIAAVAPVAGTLVGASDCAPGRPVPVIHFHGTSDLVVLYGGAATYPGAIESATGWAERNGCQPARHESIANGDSICETYQGCPSGGEVVLCTVDGGGHTWPGGTPAPVLGKTTQDLSANDVMWDFFSRHALP